MKKFLLLLFALALLVPVAMASTFSVTNYLNTFTITRSDASTAEVVMYRTVNRSAIARTHFSPTAGVLQFDVGETSKTVTVEELDVNTIPAFCCFQSGYERKYRFEVIDRGGFLLAARDRDIYYGSDYRCQNYYVSTSIKDLVFLRQVDETYYTCHIMSGMQSTDYTDVLVPGTYYHPFTVYDSETYQTPFTVSTDNLFVGSTNPEGLREYYTQIRNTMYATVYFFHDELAYGGYQYIQILADNETTYDGKDPDGKVNTPSNSVYKACFELRDEGNGTGTKVKYQFFPHRYDYYNQAEGNQSEIHTEFPMSTSRFYDQKFKNSSYRAAEAGAIVLDPSVRTLTMRFDANGKGADTWDFQNMYARLALCDDRAPMMQNIRVSEGPFLRGTPFAVTVIFNEIVDARNVVLRTNWGNLTCTQDNNNWTNAVTFTGNVADNVANNSTLYISGYDGTIKDQAGNEFIERINNTFSSYTVGQSYNYSITYDLDGGTPAGYYPPYYTYDTNTFTLANPVREGYTFLGWTGSNGDTPQTNVTITRGSHGDLYFIANWALNHTITLPSETPHGTVTCDKTTASVSETVTLTAMADAGYALGTLSVTNGDSPIATSAGESGTYTFEMPDDDVTVSAEFGLPIDSINFPDAKFRNYLLSQSYGSDGVLTDGEIAGITQIYVAYKSIADLTGIEHFTALKRLYCNHNQLTMLDVSHNTALERLDCYYNELTSLDVSQNTALTTLECYGNQITSLDVSHNTALTMLQCYNNQLGTLNLSNNSALIALDCGGNQLTALDVSHNTALEELHCYYNQLTVLDVSHNTALEMFQCCYNQLTALDVSQNTALTYLDCGGNQLTALDVSHNTALNTLGCYNNQIYGENMAALVGSLPTVDVENNYGQNGGFYVIDLDSETEQNVITTTQVTTARGKNWKVLGYINGLWEEYDGSEPTIPGDLNGDGTVDITDVNICINIILERNNDPAVRILADLSGDGTVDITDVNAIINIILTN
ncbi:MAG: InlB B-repeat-containing protein [Muribaculaceae bacterium]|nr:InlB B-repeat-containing protein [Muribaculaceae bacterium]